MASYASTDPSRLASTTVDPRFESRYQEMKSFRAALTTYEEANRRALTSIQIMVNSLDTVFASIAALSKGTDALGTVKTMCADSAEGLADVKLSAAYNALDTGLREIVARMKSLVSDSTNKRRQCGKQRNEANETLLKYSKKRQKDKGYEDKYALARKNLLATDRDYRVQYDNLLKQRNDLLPKILSVTVRVTRSFTESLSRTLCALLESVDNHISSWSDPRDTDSPGSSHTTGRSGTEPSPAAPALPLAPPPKKTPFPPQHTPHQPLTATNDGSDPQFRPPPAAAVASPSPSGVSTEHGYDYPPMASVERVTDSVPATRLVGIPV